MTQYAQKRPTLAMRQIMAMPVQDVIAEVQKIQDKKSRMSRSERLLVVAWFMELHRIGAIKPAEQEETK
jgi:hypothetical protein